MPSPHRTTHLPAEARASGIPIARELLEFGLAVRTGTTDSKDFD